MPQASDDLRARMFRYFGDEIDDVGPIEFLQSHGFVCTKGWEWIKPCESHTISEDESWCLQFLIEEWDFGGLACAQPKAF